MSATGSANRHTRTKPMAVRPTMPADSHTVRSSVCEKPWQGGKNGRQVRGCDDVAGFLAFDDEAATAANGDNGTERVRQRHESPRSRLNLACDWITALTDTAQWAGKPLRLSISQARS